jgi:hypothetical protein
MNLSRKNLLARYFRWLKGDLPQDLCTFFWGSVFNILLFPLVVPGKIWGDFVDTEITIGRNFWNGLAFWIVYLVAAAIGLGVMREFGYEPINAYGVLLLLPLIGVGVAVLVIACFILIVGGGVELSERYKARRSDAPKESSLKLWIGAIRKKYCTKITWE